MSRFYVPHESVHGKEIIVKGEEAHHIIDVMRLKLSDRVLVFDGTGKEYRGVIKAIKAKSLNIEIIETRAPAVENCPSVALIQAIPKKNKMDYIVEKATELGVSEIMPVFTERTVPKWDGSKAVAHAARWRKIAVEASKQCCRADVPEIDEPAHFNAITDKFKDYDLNLIAALSEGAVGFKEALGKNNWKRVAVAIGPEGDFTDTEIESARKAGFKLINLGPRVLKSDTAGLAVLSIINYEYSGR